MSAKNIRVFGYKVEKHLTSSPLNELVKLLIEALNNWAVVNTNISILSYHIFFLNVANAFYMLCFTNKDPIMPGFVDVKKGLISEKIKGQFAGQTFKKMSLKMCLNGSEDTSLQFVFLRMIFSVTLSHINRLSR